MKKHLLLLAILISTIAYGNNPSANRTATVTYVIPVVFHVLHQYGPENISKEQILDAIRILNEDYQHRNADTIDIIPVFQPIAADCEIEFRLATLDPNGNCTDGIERIVTPLTNGANDASKIHRWPNNNYLNVWVANTLENSQSAGYSHLPGGADSTDGILFSHMFIGSIGTGSVTSSRYLTHEIGHYLNVKHLYGSGGSCGDDGVSDTPPTGGASTCNLAMAVCNPNIIENVQNYMEFSGCSCMFTAGQKGVMDTCLNSSVSHRNNLWTPSNLAVTGTDIPPMYPCTPIADFSSIQYACAGDPLSFTDQSWNADVAAWLWSFPGGNPSTSIDSNPVVTYATPGMYDVTLMVGNTSGADTITKTTFIHISDTAMNAMPFSEDFENWTTFPAVDGWIENSLNDTLIQRTSDANSTIGGSWSLRFDNYYNIRGDRKSWVTPSINFSQVSTPIYVNFDVAHAQRTSNQEDVLMLFYSFDCGKTWSNTSYNKSGTQLSTAPVTSSFFIPNSTQWRNETVTCHPAQQHSNVRFKFECVSDAGNNVYIDNLMITGNMTAVDELSQFYHLNVYPNPANDISKVSFEMPAKSHVICTVKNILGQELKTIINESLQAGKYDLQTPVLSPGIYTLELRIDDRMIVKKIIIE